YVAPQRRRRCPDGRDAGGSLHVSSQAATGASRRLLRRGVTTTSAPFEGAAPLHRLSTRHVDSKSGKTHKRAASNGGEGSMPYRGRLIGAAISLAAVLGGALAGPALANQPLIQPFPNLPGEFPAGVACPFAVAHTPVPGTETD